MRPVVSVAEMRVADAATSVPVEVLVRRAGRAVAGTAISMLGGAYGRTVVVVAGKGNNGADGRAAAAVLAARGARVSVLDAGDRHRRVSSPPPDLVIDAAYGTGFRGAYVAPAPAGAPVLAIDVPSGVNGDTGVATPGAVHAVATVTMAALKPGLLLGEGEHLSGRVEVADIGLVVGPVGAHLVDDADHAWLPSSPRSSHKWHRAVWVAAGSPGMSGAALLCVRAAQRAGSGMVHVGSPGLVASDHPPGEAVAVALPAEGWDAAVLAELERFHALVVGPGLGRGPAVHAAVRALVAAAPVAVVVDADGLNALGDAAAVASVIAARPPVAPGLRQTGSGSTGAGPTGVTSVRSAPAPVVLTPHDAEFARLAGHPPGDDRIAAARGLAARCGAVVLLKGSTTVVADPSGAVLLVTAGDARLATAGTGDVLSGVVAAFLAAGLPGLEAAALAAHVHGRAGRLGFGVGLVAGDLPDLVACVLSGAGRAEGRAGSGPAAARRASGTWPAARSGPTSIPTRGAEVSGRPVRADVDLDPRG